MLFRSLAKSKLGEIYENANLMLERVPNIDDIDDIKTHALYVAYSDFIIKQQLCYRGEHMVNKEYQAPRDSALEKFKAAAEAWKKRCVKLGIPMSLLDSSTYGVFSHSINGDTFAAEYNSTGLKLTDAYMEGGRREFLVFYFVCSSRFLFICVCAIDIYF